MNLALYCRKYKKSTEILPPLRLTSPSAMLRAKKRSAKGQLSKKTRVLCWSFFLLIYANPHVCSLYSLQGGGGGVHGPPVNDPLFNNHIIN